jgi:hypothetical protein
VHFRINHFAKLVQKQGLIRKEVMALVLSETIQKWMESERIGSIKVMKEILDDLDMKVNV